MQCEDPDCLGCNPEAQVRGRDLLAALLGGGPLGMGFPLGLLAGSDASDSMLTVTAIEESGELRRLRIGTETEYQDLSAIEKIDTETAEAIRNAMTLLKQIESQKKEAAELRLQADDLKEHLAGRRVDLKFDIWDAVPEFYGNERLYIKEETEQLLLVNGGRHTVLEGAIGRPLYQRQEEIKNDDARVLEMRRNADHLALKTNRMPELLQHKQQQVERMIKERVLSKLGGDVVRMKFLIDENGDPQIAITKRVEERTAELTDDERDDIRRRLASMERKGGPGSRLPEGVRKALHMQPETEPTPEMVGDRQG